MGRGAAAAPRLRGAGRGGAGPGPGSAALSGVLLRVGSPAGCVEIHQPW